MSTADGLYLVISTAITTDIYRDMIAPKIHKGVPDEVLDRRALLINRIMVMVIALVALWISIPPPKYLTVLLWTGLGGFTVAISPSLIVGALFRRATKAACPVFDDRFDRSLCLSNYPWRHASFPGDWIWSDCVPGVAPRFDPAYQARIRGTFE